VSANAELLGMRLRAALEPVRLSIRDDSSAHAGHAGQGDGSHLFVHVVSNRFAGLRPIQRHRLVYDAAGDLLPGRIHALQLHTLTPEESDQE
jgi:BolA family transcriptional regulator, general stress-responsive regulator